MAVTAVSITSIADTGTVKPALTACATIADGFSFDVGGDTDNLLVELSITTSGSSPAAFSVTAGDNPPAFRAGIGDVDKTTTGSAADARYMLVFESARVIQSDGKLLLTLDDAKVTAASAAAYRLPQGL